MITQERFDYDDGHLNPTSLSCYRYMGRHGIPYIVLEIENQQEGRIDVLLDYDSVIQLSNFFEVFILDFDDEDNDV
jgi:hypothetical protein